MKIWHLGRSFAAGFLALLLSAAALADNMDAATNPGPGSNGSWNWVRVAAPVDPGRAWQVEQGMTDVDFDGEHFTAILKADTEKVRHRYRIEGTIHGSDVTVTEIVENTDAGPQTYRGSIRRVKIADNWEREDIALKGDWGSFFIGLVRNVRSKSSANP